MSETHLVHGKAKAVSHPQDKLETIAEHILRQRGLDRPEWADTWLEELLERDEAYVLAGGILYELIECEEKEETSFFNGILNADRTISFTVSYYDGSTGFGEAVGEAIKNAQSGNGNE